MRSTLKVWVLGQGAEAATITDHPTPDASLRAANAMIGRDTKIGAWDDLGESRFLYYDDSVVYLIFPAV